jgi:hypothetical protein
VFSKQDQKAPVSIFTDEMVVVISVDEKYGLATGKMAVPVDR